jgi:hypothetical protein
MYEQQRKDDSRNVDGAADKIGASAIVPPLRNAPTTLKLAYTLQLEAITPSILDRLGQSEMSSIDPRLTLL